MSEQIQHIPTTWNGVTYRSRTEARWAVFLSALSVIFDYEPEPYRLSNGLYLPDFRIPEWNVFIEIKGAEPTPEEIAKCKELAELTKCSVLLANGAPSGASLRVFGEPHGQERWATLAECRGCKGYVLELWFDRAGNDWAGRTGLGEHLTDRCMEKGGGAPPSRAIARAADERFGVHPK